MVAWGYEISLLMFNMICFLNNNVIVDIVSSPFELLEYSPLWTRQLPKIFEVSNPTKPVENHPTYSRYINRMHNVHKIYTLKW